MKKLLTALVFAGLAAIQLKAMDVSISYATFKSPGQNFIEIYFHIAGKTVEFIPVTDTTFQAGVEVLILFKQDEEIVKFDKYNLNSPVSRRPIDFIDQKRYGLDNGLYQLVVQIKDLNSPENAKEFQASFEMNYDGETLQQSDLQLLATYYVDSSKGPFVKNGLYMEPLPYNFYGKTASTLSFYNEIYNADKAIGDDFVITYIIQKVENGQAEIVMIGNKRKKPTAFVPVLLQLDISQLQTGNYNLVLEVRSRAKELLGQKSIYFQRSNPYLQIDLDALTAEDLGGEFVSKLNADQLKYSLRSITPKLPPRDMEMVNNILKSGNLDNQRAYLFSFWVQESPNNPEFAYRKYMEVVAAVEEHFRSGFRYGFETDRGYYFLKYGQPDDIETRENEPSAPPYEVWSYYDFPATRQGNVKFIFYNPSLAPGDFVLLHSTAIGELNNPQWQRVLYRNSPNEIDNDYFEGMDVQDNLGRHGRRVFSDY
jgi:GWxTD domain-containing protein